MVVSDRDTGCSLFVVVGEHCFLCLWLLVTGMLVKYSLFIVVSDSDAGYCLCLWLFL